METLELIKTPLKVAQFVGRQLLGGGWSELPALPQEEPIRRPARAAIHYFSTPEVPANVELGQE